MEAMRAFDGGGTAATACCSQLYWPLKSKLGAASAVLYCRCCCFCSLISSPGAAVRKRLASDVIWGPCIANLLRLTPCVSVEYCFQLCW
jgi:hypothetical protein